MKFIEKIKSKCQDTCDKCIGIAKKHPIIASSVLAIAGAMTAFSLDNLKNQKEEAKATEEWNQWLTSADSDDLRDVDNVLRKKWNNDGQPDNDLCLMRTDIDNELGKRWAKEHENDPAYNPDNPWTDECRWDKD